MNDSRFISMFEAAGTRQTMGLAHMRKQRDPGLQLSRLPEVTARASIHDGGLSVSELNGMACLTTPVNLPPHADRLEAWS